MEEGGPAEHAEGPLIGVGDKGNPLVAEQGRPLLTKIERVLGREFFRGDDLPLFRKSGKESGLGEFSPLGGGLAVKGAQHRAVAVVDPTVAVTKGPRFDLAFDGAPPFHGFGPVSSGFRSASGGAGLRASPNSDKTRCQNSLRTTASPATPPNSNCRKRLPVPGSM